jgi:hypothetical protein
MAIFRQQRTPLCPALQKRVALERETRLSLRPAIPWRLNRPFAKIANGPGHCHGLSNDWTFRRRLSNSETFLKSNPESC